MAVSAQNQEPSLTSEEAINIAWREMVHTERITCEEIEKEITKNEAIERARGRFKGLRDVSTSMETWKGKPVWRVTGKASDHHYWWMFPWTTDHQIETIVDRESGDVLEVVKDGVITYPLRD